MHELDLDGVQAWYYPAGEDVPPEVTEDVFRYEFRYDALTMDHPRLRQVILPKGTNGLNATLFAVLHWNDGTDLPTLDRMLELGADASDTIGRALLCEVHNATCPNCGATYVLLRPFGDFPAGDIRKHGRAEPSRTCPNCGHTRFPPHVEVLEA
jgi:hypothetical protein